MVVELVLPHVSCWPSLVSAPTKCDGGCTAGCHSCSPTISVARPGSDLGKLLVEMLCEGFRLLLHFGQIQSSTEVWVSGRGGSPRMLLQGLCELIEAVAACICYPCGFGPRACCVHCVHSGFPWEQRALPSAGCAPDLGTHCPIVGHSIGSRYR